MKTTKFKNFKSSILLVFLFLAPSVFAMISLTFPTGMTVTEQDSTSDKFSNIKYEPNHTTPITSDVTYTGTKYDLSKWWDTRFRFRMGIEVEETENIDRYQPVDVFLSFNDNEHYEGSARLVSFNATGNDEWSNEIPMQVWNATKYPSGYIQSCTITFLANISAGSNQTYFLYFNENLSGIGVPSYDTDFTSSLVGGKLTVTVGDLGERYKVVLEQGKGVSELIKDNKNLHSDDSLSPEKQLVLSDLRFLAHMDEGSGNYVNDSTGNVSPGQLINGPTWTEGIVRYGLDFENTASQYVNFGAALEGPGDPFDGLSTEFTIAAWIKPESISTTTRSNHLTYNCFMAKASDAINDNFEVGVNLDGSIHIYLDTETRDTQADFGNAGDVVVGQWNFIAIRYNSGTLEVRINDNDWYPSSAWNGATDLDEADGSLFTIGSTDHQNTYFDGVIDEVAIYNVSLTDQEIEDYKYGSETSIIQSITELENGDVFSRYEVVWTESFDMHVSDICTFYYDYNLWNINRTISFDSGFNGEDTNSQMVAANTYYDLSGFFQNEQFDYIYDGNLIQGLNDDGFTVENYTIIHDPINVNTKNTVGLFVSNFQALGDAFSEISYLEGMVSYDAVNDIVSYTPGSINDYKNNANPNNELNIQFWEFIDHVNQTTYQPKLTEVGMETLFENMYHSLKIPMNIYVYDKDAKFYNLNVNVTDIDGNLVTGATITVWNQTNPTMSWSQLTNTNGETTFTRLDNGTYIVNATYVKYGQAPLVITNPQVININEGTVDNTGLYEMSFTNVQLTSLKLTLDQYNSTNAYKGRLAGAQVTFTIDSGLGAVDIGSESSDSNGHVTFRWNNFTDASDGNVTFTIKWFDTQPINMSAPGDLNSELNKVTYYFYEEMNVLVNVTFGPSFDTELIFTVIPTEMEMLDDIVYFQVNYTYIINSSVVYPLLGATVIYDIKIGTTILNTQTLSFTEIGGGLYNLSIDTTAPLESGGASWLSSISYTIEVQASKASFITQETSLSFTLRDKTAHLTVSDTSINAYWNEFLEVEVNYQDISNGGNLPIDGATVEYFVIGVPSVFGYLTPSGVAGGYLFSVDTTVFPGSDSYTIQISANKQNYEEKSVFIDATIFAIKTLINGSVGIYKDVEVTYRESQVFYFNYSVDETGEGLTSSSIKSYEWTKEVGSSVVESGAGILTEVGSGLYALDFGTETKEIASYTLIFNLEKDNYAPRSGIIILNIIPRKFDVTLPTTNKIISAISGQSLTFSIDLNDLLNGSELIGCDLSIALEGTSYDFIDNDDGTYSVTIPSLPEAFFLPIPIAGQISIEKDNYETEVIDITINVGMVEIFPGFPLFYFIIIVAGAGLIVVALLSYYGIQQSRIPTFVKRARSMKKVIKGKKSVSESLLYPSKEEFVAKTLGDKWEMLGLSLNDILGIESKRRKKIPNIEEPQGGAE
jgi:hypothetical protein